MSVNSRHQSSSTVKALFAGAMTKVKAEAAEATAKVKAEAAEVIAMVKAEAAEAIERGKAEAEEKERAYTSTAGKGRPSTTVEVLFSDAVAKQKAKSEAEAAEAIAWVKAEAEEMAKVYTDTIARVKAEAEEAIAEQKAKSEAEAAEAIARVKVEAEEKTRTYIDTIAKIKAEAEEKARAYTDTVGKGKPSATVDALFSEAVAKQKAKSEAEAAEAIARVKAEAEEMVKAYTDTIARVKAEAEEAIAKVRAEFEAETRVYTDTTAKVKAEEKTTIRNEGEEQPVSETIQRITQSPAVLPGEHARKTSALCTKDIMQKKLVWGSPDDSVQQAFAKVQQHGAGYMLVGRNGVLEGIVSRSDLTGAISPYLRPIFSKWRRPMDDATLQIRIKWIMSRPVHIISPQMPLAAIMRNMCRSRVRALPVADQQGKVLGLVTETNIFKAILKLRSDPNVPASDKGYQEQSASPQAPEHTRTQPIKTNQPSLVTA